MTAGIADRSVLRTRRHPRDRLGQIHAPVALGVCAEIGEHGRDAGSRMLAQDRVELAVRSLPGIEVTGRRLLVHFRERRIHLLEIARRQPRHGDLDRERLERYPSRVELLEIGHREGGDPHSPVRLGEDQPLALQHP